MAAAKGKRKTGTKTTGREAAGRNTRKRLARSSEGLKGLGIVMIAFAALTMYALVSSSNTIVTQAMRRLITGGAGIMRWPVILLIAGYGVMFLLRKKPGKLGWIAILCGTITVLLQISAMEEVFRQLRLYEYPVTYMNGVNASYLFYRTTAFGGGWLGALAAYPIHSLLGKTGGIILMVLALIAEIVIFVQKYFPNVGSMILEWYTPMMERLRAEREQNRLDREEARKLKEKEEAIQVPIPKELLQSDVPEEEAAPKKFSIVRKPKTSSRVQDESAQERRTVQEQPAAVMEQKHEKEQPAFSTQPAFLRRERTEKPKGPVHHLYMEDVIPEERRSGYGKTEGGRVTTDFGIIREEGKAEAGTEIGNKENVFRSEMFEEITAETETAYHNLPERKYVPDNGFAYQEESAHHRRRRVHISREEPQYVAEQPVMPENDESSDLQNVYTEPEEETELTGEEKQRTIGAAGEEAEIMPQKKETETSPQVKYNLSHPEYKPTAEERLDQAALRMPEKEHERAEEIKPKGQQEYRCPPVDLLEGEFVVEKPDTHDQDVAAAQKLVSTLHSFNVEARVTNVVHGPAITRYELQPAPGVKVSKIAGLVDDIALNMAAIGVRIEAPIPGKAAVGIEIANSEIATVHLRDVLDSEEFNRNNSRLAVALGKDIAGKRIIADLAKMPHLLIAGATGSGKSVCINTIIVSLIYRSKPEEVRLILIDPKKVELSVYNGIPHLLIPVVCDPKKASGALNWAVTEMDERYKRFAELNVRDIKGYNAARPEGTPLMPSIVVIIDELSDLMMVAPGEVEDAICRLAQLARACGIHLVIATQRPSVNVITGIIKANIPSRIAFAVSSQVDSRTILDAAGAEKLLGKGDMLYAPAGSGKPTRVQGCFVSDGEVNRVVEYVKDRHECDYSQAVIDALENQEEENAPVDEEDKNGADEDELLREAVELAVESGQASISMLQRRLRVGYARAGRLIDTMAMRGFIGQAEGSKPRPVLITREDMALIFKK